VFKEFVNIPATPDITTMGLFNASRFKKKTIPFIFENIPLQDVAVLEE
jgi:hypothetical protein